MCATPNSQCGSDMSEVSGLLSIHDLLSKDKTLLRKIALCKRKLLLSDQVGLPRVDPAQLQTSRGLSV